MKEEKIAKQLPQTMPYTVGQKENAIETPYSLFVSCHDESPTNHMEVSNIPFGHT